VGRVVADEDARALSGQRVRLGVGLHVRTAYPEAAAEQHACDGRHAGPADADDVDAHSGF